eukprot:TRINITY_DN11920_c0_g1_i1.p2 TRINITY_DN11920_c0_g1~~TRINITY_DN11920_c0_g1_i1.p2  ORF type:complete len:104 (+),score=2.17 TRINITY_DN11920_c0_g1_i1:500-811(+)
MFDKMNPSDGKHPRYLATTPTYPEFVPTYKCYHVYKLCTCCRLSGHLTSVCPLHNIFITEDIHAIVHTDPNPTIPCKNEIFNGEYASWRHLWHPFFCSCTYNV